MENKNANSKDKKDQKSPGEAENIDQKNQGENPAKQLRQIVIETNGNTVVIKSAQVAGNLELESILKDALKQIGKL